MILGGVHLTLERLRLRRRPAVRPRKQGRECFVIGADPDQAVPEARHADPRQPPLRVRIGFGEKLLDRVYRAGQQFFRIGFHAAVGAHRLRVSILRFGPRQRPAVRVKQHGPHR